MATTTKAPQTGAERAGARVHVQRFGTFLSNMVLPNIGAFIAWGLITALFIPSGWITLVGVQLFGYTGGYGFVGDLAGWTSNAAAVAACAPDALTSDVFPGFSVCAAETAGIVGPMITYLLPLLIGYTGGRMMYRDTMRGGVVGAIATFGAIAGASVPMFLGAMIMGPLGGWSMRKLDALWDGKIRPGFEMLVNNFSAGIWGGILAVVGFVVAGPAVTAFSTAAGKVVDFLVVNNLLPLASVFVEPAKILFLNNAINQGILTPLGISEAAEQGQSILFLVEANPGPGLGLLLAFMFFGKGIAKASAPGAILIQFVGGIHEIYFPYVLMKPKLILAVIGGGMAGIATNLAFGSGLRSPASPGSIIAVWASSPPSSLVGVTLSVIAAAGVSFAIAAVLLRFDRAEDDGDLAAATADMEANKGKKSSVASSLGGAARPNGPIRSIVFACDAGMGSSAMGASVLRRKIHEAGHGDVSVVNKAISNLGDDQDVVVTHQDLTARARQKAGSAVHVSVANFMNSPRYDEILAMVEQANGGGSGASAPVEDDSPATGDVLTESSVVLGGNALDRDQAIEEAGRLLVAAGAVDESYVAAMHQREQSVSTHMGNGLALPHGTNESKDSVRRTALSFVRYDQPVDWNGKPAEFVVGIAGQGKEHLALISKLARVFTDDAQVERLRAASTPAEVLAVLDGVRV